MRALRCSLDICSDPLELDNYDSSSRISPKDKAEICREYRLRSQVFSRWREEFLKRAPEIFATKPSRGDEQERIAELERMIGRLTMELEMAKKASNILTSLSTRSGR
jgi:transposase-like protein